MFRCCHIENKWLFMLFIFLLFTILSCTRDDEEWREREISFNPYANIDFSNIVRVSSSSHEHIINQESLENCWNRGIRNINISNYQPSAPFLLRDNNTEVSFLDWNNERCERIVTKNISPVAFHDFVDNNGDIVKVSGIVCLPNAERVNLSNYSYMLHSLYLGSSFGDAGWIAMTSDAVSWRIEHPLLDSGELWRNIRDNSSMGSIFGILAHPLSAVSKEEAKAFIKGSNGLIQGIEVFNQGIPTETNRAFRDFYDELICAGFRLWCVSATDWQGNFGDKSIIVDRGGQQLLLPGKYNDMSTEEKESACLSAYCQGTFFPFGIGSLQVDSILVNEEKISIYYNKTCNLDKIVGGKRTYIGLTKEYEQEINRVRNYIRFEAYTDNGDFVFTQPIFVRDL